MSNIVSKGWVACALKQLTEDLPNYFNRFCSTSKLSPSISYPFDLNKTNKQEGSKNTAGIWENICWVIGNEAADLDSIISSISYALLQAKLQEARSAYPKELFIPLINLSRNELALRPEVIYVLERCSLPSSDILFIDDPLVAEYEKVIKSLPQCKFVLLDHNKLHSRFVDWEGKVKAIYDHHQDEKFHLDSTPRVIKQVGSNISIITEWWRNNCFETNEDYIAELSPLMLAPILIDTVNLKGQYGRVTPLDLEAASYLESKDPLFASRDSYFAAIDAAKINVSHMSSEQLLRKDFKLWVTPVTSRRLGMSAIVNWCHSDWLDRNPDTNGPEDSMRDYARKWELDILVVLTSKKHALEKTSDSEFRRELYIYSSDLALVEFLSRQLTSVGELELVPLKGTAPSSTEFKFYLQKVVSASRKVSYPILRDLIDQFPQQKL